MLDKALHSHLDEMETIESAIVAEIDSIIGEIDIDLVIKDPEKAMLETVLEIKNVILEKYAPMATKNGFDLAELLKKYMAKDKEIAVDPSQDPNKNEDALDGRNN